MAHQKLLMGLKAGLFVATIWLAGYLTPAFALDFVPGKWQITNWIESPDGRQGMKERSTECLTETDILPFRCEAPDCDKMNFQLIDNTVTFFYKVKTSNNPLEINGRFIYSGNKFDGVMLYVDQIEPSNSMKVVIKGEFIGECDN